MATWIFKNGIVSKKMSKYDGSKTNTYRRENEFYLYLVVSESRYTFSTILNFDCI
jgi:hypothetical protein